MINKLNEDKWYEEITNEIEGRYIEAVDKHWNGKDPQNFRLLKIKEVEYPQGISRDFRNRDAVGQLLQLKQFCDTPLQHGDSPQQEQDIIVERMIQYLAIWLCAYFLGVPQPHWWESVAKLSFRLGAYPGLGYYDKIAGDVYRQERKARDKYMALTGELPPARTRKGILVMAFTPTIVIPENADKAIENLYSLCSSVNSSTTNSTFKFKEDYLRRDSKTHRFCKAVERLACRYLRLQIWLYTSRGYEITYLFQRQVAQQEMKLLKDENQNLEKLQEESDERVRRFFCEHSPQQIQKIGGITWDQMAGRGLSTCTLGHDGGILTTQPYKQDQPIHCCLWIRDLLLNVERDKIDRLLNDFDVHPRYYDYEEGFTKKWWVDIEPS
jgi:hypothetical protein